MDIQDEKWPFPLCLKIENAVEKNKDRISIIDKNISTFNIKNINVIQSELPAGIEKLPNPDRIFIGGGGKDLRNIAEKAIQKLSI